MATEKRWRGGALISLVTVLGACGGGGSDGVSPGTPTATVPARADLPVPFQSPLLASPIAVQRGPTLETAPPNTLIPLLQVAVDEDFAGDEITTSQGATLALNVSPGRTAFTLNNTLLDVVDAAFPSSQSRIPRDRRLSAGANGMWSTNRMQYVLVGGWYITNDPAPNQGTSFQNGGAFTGGYVSTVDVLRAATPAGYVGKTFGLYEEPVHYFALISGTVRLSVDFAARSVTGVFTDLGIGSDSYPYGPEDDLAFTAVLDLATNRFDGILEPATPRPNPAARPARGSISGRIFGPNAEEVGAVWTVTGESRRFIGSLGASRDTN